LRLETIAAAGSEGMQIAALENRACRSAPLARHRIAPTVVLFMHAARTRWCMAQQAS